MKQNVTDISEAMSSLAKRIESMQKTFDSQRATICRINRTSQGQLKEIRNLKRDCKKKDKLIVELQERLSKYEDPPKNSDNSSTPPSKEEMRDEIIRRTKSLRKPTGKNPGGQPGHDGSTLKVDENPDVVVAKTPDVCDKCGDSLGNCEMELDYITQIISLPELKPLVTKSTTV